MTKSRRLKVLLADGIHFTIDAASYRYQGLGDAGAGVSFLDENGERVCFVAQGQLIAVLDERARAGDIEKVATSSPKEKPVKRVAGRRAAA
jgi:hypothetical protein